MSPDRRRSPRFVGSITNQSPTLAFTFLRSVGSVRRHWFIPPSRSWPVTSTKHVVCRSISMIFAFDRLNPPTPQPCRGG